MTIRFSPHFSHTSRRHMRKNRNVRRDKTFLKADYRDAGQELGDQAFAMLSSRYSSLN